MVRWLRMSDALMVPGQDGSGRVFYAGDIIDPGYNVNFNSLHWPDSRGQFLVPSLAQESGQ